MTGHFDTTVTDKVQCMKYTMMDTLLFVLWQSPCYRKGWSYLMHGHGLRLMMIYIHAWPPDQPHIFTPLLLVHHEGQQRIDQAVEVAKTVCRSDVSSVTAEKLVCTKLDDHACLQI